MDKNQHKDFDKFFQNKLNERQFEYQDDFWGEMETLLPKEDTDIPTAGQPRSRYLSGILLILMIGVIGWLSYPYTTNTKKTVGKIENKDNQSEDILNNEINKTLNTDANTSSKHQNIVETESNNIEKEVLQITKKTKNSDRTGELTEKTGRTTFNNNNLELDENSSVFPNTSSKTFNNQFLNPKEKLIFPTTKEGNSTKTTKPLANNTSTSEDVININQVIDNSSELVDIKNEQDAENNLSTNTTLNINSSTNNNLVNNNLLDLNYLESILIDEISTTNTSKITEEEPNCDGCPYPPNFRKFNIGLIAGLSASQGWENSLSTRAVPSIDPAVGVRLSYRNSPISNWTYSTEIMYWSRSSLNAKYNYDSISYGFGVNTTTTNIDFEELHNISMPIYAVYNRKQHQLMGGLYLNYLLNTKSVINGETRQSTSTSTELYSVTPSTQQWGYISPFNRFDIGLALGYDYEIKEGWRLGIRMNYGLTDIAKNDIFNNNTFDNNLNVRILMTCDLIELKF